MLVSRVLSEKKADKHCIREKKTFVNAMINDESQEQNAQDSEEDYRLAMLRSPLRQQGLLLDMLAEVASKTLFEPVNNTTNVIAPNTNIPSIVDVNTKVAELPPPTKKKRVSRIRKSSQNEPSTLNIDDISALPPHRLLKTFSRSDCNELRRIFSFTCTLEPDVCKETFTSFGSEARARKQMLDHLKEHVYQLSLQDTNENVNGGKVSNSKAVIPTVNKKKEMLIAAKNQSPAPVLTRTKTKAELAENKGPAHAIKFDHCYSSVGLNGDSRPTSPTLYMDPVTVKLDINSALDSFVSSETFNIEFVECEQLPLTPVVGQEVNVAAEEITVQPFMDTFPDVQPQECVVETNRAVQTQLELDMFHKTITELVTPRTNKKKTKGKAKFIGQSSSERILAMNMIDQIKKKQLSPLDSLECRICEPPRTFTAPTTLLSHYRSHAGIKPYECRICRAAFTRQHSLNYHLLIHSNETRFTCRDCGRKFRHPSHFREHQRRHTGESPYECVRCSARFKTRNTYKRHLKTRHNQVLSPDGELVSTEPLPPSLDMYPQSPDSAAESDSSSQDSRESPDSSKQEDTIVVFPGTKSPGETLQAVIKKEEKEDIVKQAMRCSNISFDLEEEVSTLHTPVAVHSAIKNTTSACCNEHNNNIEDVKNILETCSVDTVLTFQYATAVSDGKNKNLETKVGDPNNLVVMY